MTKEFASLLAQVIPVFLIALGLEIRSLGPRVVEVARRDKEAGKDRDPSFALKLIHWTHMVACAVMPSLGILEIRALLIAGVKSEDRWFLAAIFAIAIVCLIPVVQGMSYFAEAWDAIGKSPRETVFWLGPFAAVCMIATLLALSTIS